MAEQRPVGEIRVNRIKEITCPKGHVVDISRAKPMSLMDCPSCGTPVRVPAQIGHYLLVKLLARGSSGAVYQAYDEKLARQVAFKVIYQAADVGKDCTQEALREARVLAMVNHPNIAQVYAFEEDMGQPYITMELVDGGRCDKLIGQAEPVTERRALEIGWGVASALGAVNELGRMHGDVKPGNILLSRNGTPKLIDFGLAQRLNGRDTNAGKTIGTPYYVAPELVRGLEADARADMFSLGATLYHLLAQRPPFEGETPRDVMLARLEGPCPDLSSFRSDLHEPTTALIHQLMATDPADRFATMFDVYHAFAAAMAVCAG
ncbi:MAG: serine/threonine protein kinase [Planctomycetes bacterium]|nr:serine/threonine protein kinase [Planctomycetota bacterium]